jgi:hypothetical protein
MNELLNQLVAELINSFSEAPDSRFAVATQNHCHCDAPSIELNMGGMYVWNVHD